MKAQDLDLIRAVKRNSPEEVAAALAAGADPKLRDRGLPILLRVDERRKDILCALVEAGADGRRLGLVWAVGTRRLATVEALIRQGADVDAQALSGTPLQVAAALGCLDLVGTLLAAGADPDAGSPIGTPLLAAIGGAHSETACLLVKSGADPSLTPDLGSETPLGSAIAAGLTEVVRALLEAGAEPNEASSFAPPGSTVAVQTPPAAIAASLGRTDLLELLLAKGADPRRQDGEGRTAHDLAAAARHKAVLAVLARSGATATRKSPDEDLLLAAERGSARAVAAALARGASVDARDRRERAEGRTPLQHAVEGGHVGVAKVLLDARASMAVKDDEGMTPFLRACELGHLKLVRLFLERGADPGREGPSGQTALDVARALGRTSVAAVLARVMPNKAGRSRGAGRPAPGPPTPPCKEVPRPRLGMAARGSAFRGAVKALGERCGSRPVALEETSGFLVHLRTNRRGKWDTERVQSEFIARGCFVFEFASGKRGPESLAILPTTDKYVAIAAMQTDGVNSGVGTGDIVEFLKRMEREQPFLLTRIGCDTLAGRFLSPVADPNGLATRMYEFCPDIVDQGCGSVRELARILKRAGTFFFWWD